MTSPFLTARWENLILLNYDCPSDLLTPLVPEGTVLDEWNGSHIVSLVGFLFADTKLRGLPIPFHRTFEEINLRFYVRRETALGEVRRAVVFIKEIVSRPAIAAVARLVYNEPYSALPTFRRIELDPDLGGELEYGWAHPSGRHAVRATVSGPPADIEAGSEAEFITEHYWGYSRQRDGGTIEYRVDHPRWRVWTPSSCDYDAPGTSDVYPRGFTRILAEAPRSAFVAQGSPVSVFAGKRLA